MWKSQRTSQKATKYIKTHTGQHKKTKKMINTDPTKNGGTLNRQAVFFYNTSAVFLIYAVKYCKILGSDKVKK